VVGGAPRTGYRARTVDADAGKTREPVLPGGDGPDAGGDGSVGRNAGNVPSDPVRRDAAGAGDGAGDSGGADRSAGRRRQAPAAGGGGRREGRAMRSP